MKTRISSILVLSGAIALGPALHAEGGRGKGGGGARPAVSRPAAQPAARPQPRPAAKPSGGSGSYRPPTASVSKPSGGGGARLPQTRPAAPQPRPHPPQTRPAARPQTPQARPQIPQTRPQVPQTRPETPQARPQIPQTRPVERPSTGVGLPSLGGTTRPNLPSTRPAVPSTRPALPERPTTLPATRPGGGSGRPSLDDFLGLRPSRPGDGSRPERPTTLPGRPGDLPGISTRPNRPTTLPARPGIDNRPGFGQRPEQPTTLPGIADNRPGGRPERPARPNRPDNWQNVVNNNQDQWNSWRQQNQTTVNNFQVNRTNNWNNITNNYHNDGWSGRFGSDEYWEWRGDVLDFRRDRCNEVWDRREDFWDDMFDHHWWGSCWWAPPRPYPYYGYGVNVSPWWSWRPVIWASIGAFFGNALGPKPVVYDPGTTVIYEGDTVYINGKAADNATEARRTAAVLATPVVEQVPVPEPAPEGQPEQWMPLGVWALTQQEQGDATMFLQISVDKQGIVAGAYKNVLTGDEQPVVGRVDLPTQRVAWHVGEASQTVYETSLGNFENDVASVFVHFGDNATQTWLLVRLPSPEIPPSTVKLPSVKPE